MNNETLHIGSEDDDGAHLREPTSWPYSIYRRDDEPGRCDRVLCHGIQSLEDANHLLALLSASDAASKLSGPYRPITRS